MEYPNVVKVFLDKQDENIFLGKNSVHELPFFIPNETFEIIHDSNEISKGTIVPVMFFTENIPNIVNFLGEKINDVVILILLHTHNVEYNKLDNWIQYVVDTWKPYTDNVLVCMTVSKYSNHPNHIWYDFLWDRAKLYYTDYDISLLGPGTGRLWTYQASDKMFELSKIEKQQYFPLAPFKPILAPVKSNSPINYATHATDLRMKYRKKLLRHLDNSFAYYSDWESKPRKLLESEEPYFRNTNGIRFAGWFPIANAYYNATFVSAYVETLVETSQSTGITEKTFDPLIKGHFILPFGYKGIVKDIQEIYGFKLPEWIDYSYDAESDIDIRFDLFLKEMYRLSRISIDEYLILFREDSRILEHNRKVFYTRSYDLLSTKIKESSIWRNLVIKNNNDG